MKHACLCEPPSIALIVHNQHAYLHIALLKQRNIIRHHDPLECPQRTRVWFSRSHRFKKQYRNPWHKQPLRFNEALTGCAPDYRRTIRYDPA